MDLITERYELAQGRIAEIAADTPACDLFGTEAYRAFLVPVQDISAGCAQCIGK